MTNQYVLIKIKQRLNKLTSFDYDDIEPWMIAEAFNKAQRNWTRRQIEGVNQERTGAEQTIRRVDDLQILLQPWGTVFTNQGLYYESCDFPIDYLDYNRISAWGQDKCCPPRKFKVYLADLADVDILLADHNRRPSFHWAETFATISGNKVQIYTNGEFSITEAQLIYYRQPQDIQISGSVDPATNLTITTDVVCEFQDDIAEIFTAEAAEILAADIESQQASRNKSDADTNT